MVKEINKHRPLEIQLSEEELKNLNKPIKKDDTKSPRYA